MRFCVKATSTLMMRRMSFSFHVSLIVNFLNENVLFSNERMVNNKMSFMISKCLIALTWGPSSCQGGNGPQKTGVWNPPFSTGRWVSIWVSVCLKNFFGESVEIILWNVCPLNPLNLQMEQKEDLKKKDACAFWWWRPPDNRPLTEDLLHPSNPWGTGFQCATQTVREYLILL